MIIVKLCAVCGIVGGVVKETRRVRENASHLQLVLLQENFKEYKTETVFLNF
jgi:hypothetical protein